MLLGVLKLQSTYTALSRPRPKTGRFPQALRCLGVAPMGVVFIGLVSTVKCDGQLQSSAVGNFMWCQGAETLFKRWEKH